MAIIAGCDGTAKVKVSAAQTYIGQVKDWTLQVSRELIDVSILRDSASPTDAGWKKSYPGFKSWSGSLTVNWDVQSSVDLTQKTITDAVVANNTAIEIELYTDDATAKPNKRGYKGNVYVQSFSVRTAVSGIVEMSINFTGSGALVTDITQLSGNI